MTNTNTTPTTTATPAVPERKVWTFFGHWEDDRIVVEYVTRGEHEDEREETGHWEGGLWADSGWGTTQAEAQANAIAEYEEALHSNPAYPNGRCHACGWGLSNDLGCPNPDCERAGTKLPADDEEDDQPATHRYVTTFTFDATDDKDATGLLGALTDAMETSDAIPTYGQTGFTTPRLDATWPTTGADRDAFANWQHEVANGDTLRGFRDWQAELDTDLDG